MEAARPTQTVDTSGRMWRIVSNTAMPAVVAEPKGRAEGSGRGRAEVVAQRKAQGPGGRARAGRS